MGQDGDMASIRKRVRKDGSITWAVLYTLNKTQTSVPFTTEREAEKFRDAVNSLGPQRANEAWKIPPTVRVKPHGPLLRDWLEHYIEHLTGVTKTTLYDYRSYARLYINPKLGDLPLSELTREDVSKWVKEMAATPNRQKKPPSGKTLANRHGFLSAALNTAVKAGHIPSNPAAGTRLPRTEKPENVFLSEAEFKALLAEVPDHWKPLTEFLFASGARFGEVSALRPSDVDREAGTVSIKRAWKRTYAAGGYELGPTKTKRSDRTIDVDKRVLETLDYTGKWLFANRKGDPVRVASFRANVWWPAITRAKLKRRPRIHDARHTCASWMLAAGNPITTVSRHLGHESIQVTVDVYGHLDRSSGRAAAASIGDIIH
jgi:integrase